MRLGSIPPSLANDMKDNTSRRVGADKKHCVLWQMFYSETLAAANLKSVWIVVPVETRLCSTCVKNFLGDIYWVKLVKKAHWIGNGRQANGLDFGSFMSRFGRRNYTRERGAERKTGPRHSRGCKPGMTVRKKQVVSRSIGMGTSGNDGDGDGDGLYL
jgi:hypothetical protein